MITGSAGGVQAHCKLARAESEQGAGPKPVQRASLSLSLVRVPVPRPVGSVRVECWFGRCPTVTQADGPGGGRIGGCGPEQTQPARQGPAG